MIQVENGGDYGVTAGGYDNTPYYFRVIDNNFAPNTDPYCRVTIAQTLSTKAGTTYTVSLAYQFPSFNIGYQFITVKSSSIDGPHNVIQLGSDGGASEEGFRISQGTFTAETDADILTIDCVAVSQTNGNCYIDSVEITPDTCVSSPPEPTTSAP